MKDRFHILDERGAIRENMHTHVCEVCNQRRLHVYLLSELELFRLLLFFGFDRNFVHRVFPFLTRCDVFLVVVVEDDHY